MSLNQENPHDSWEFWLAKDKNYIPARVVGYTYAFSKTIPVSEGLVHEWRDVERGVWFPTKTTFVAYNKQKTAAVNIQEEQWKEEIAVEKVSLEPDYPKKYFQDVPFP